jgi:hypothetical protein
MTQDRYQINADGTANVIIFSNWLIALLRISGYDFGTTEIKIVRNPFVTDREELAFVFMNLKMEKGEDGEMELKDKKFLSLLEEYYTGQGIGGYISKFRNTYRDTMDIICKKVKLNEDCYSELRLTESSFDDDSGIQEMESKER